MYIIVKLHESGNHPARTLAMCCAAVKLTTHELQYRLALVFLGAYPSVLIHQPERAERRHFRPAKDDFNIIIITDSEVFSSVYFRLKVLMIC